MSTFFGRTFATTAALVIGLTLAPAPAQAEPASSPAKDGLSSETAAASCFEIKQQDPNSTSGAYWLYTPQMSAPAQFYCDQKTNGGGWVLIGRGREGWSDTFEGKGNESDLASNPDGADAFTPTQLSSNTVNALLNGTAPSALDDGVRFRRATNMAGTTWQEAYAHRDQVQTWSWALSAWSNWSNISFDNGAGNAWTKTYPGTMDRIAQYNSTLNTILFAGKAIQNWNLGFAFGTNTKGSPDSTSYIYGVTNTAGNAIPFAQVYLRPKVTQADLQFAAVADSGTPVQNRRALPNSYSEKMRWRTSAETGTGAKGELNTQVQAIDQVGQTVFTAGDFKNVVSADGEIVQQAFIAGFDVNSGELVRSFTPQVNGQIKAVKALPNGKLVVGGEFTQVNGEDAAGLVVLDPVTGAIDHTWDWKIENRNSGESVAVKTFDVQGNYLYVGGTFTHAKGATSAVAAYSKYAARFRLDNGSVDWNWRPIFNGTVNGIDASDDGAQVFFAGYFSSVNNEKAFRLASLNTTNAQRTAQWDWKLSFEEARTPEYSYQHDVQDVGSSVWTGGTEHLIAQYNKSTFARLSSSITKDGGDFQDLSYHDGVVFGACHCGDAIYQGADTWKGAWNEANDVQQVRLIGAWDAQTGKVLPEFNPQLKGFLGNGVWESFTDSTGTLWAGGDIATSLGAQGVQNTVGFARFAPRDVTAPDAPTSLNLTVADHQDQLSWKGATGSTFQIIRNDRVIASTTKTQYSIDHQDGARYFVRAKDAAGNLSASTPVAVAPVGPADPVTEVVQEPVVSNGDSWQYKVGISAIDSSWNALSTSVADWQSGASPLGWGNSGMATSIDRGASTPLSVYFRKEVQISDLQKVQKLTLSVIVDDGAVVYINGQEVGRQNITVAKPSYNTYASVAPSWAVAQQKPLTIEVNADQLKEGTNVISVETHANWKNSPIAFNAQGLVDRQVNQ